MPHLHLELPDKLLCFVNAPRKSILLVNLAQRLDRFGAGNILSRDTARKKRVNRNTRDSALTKATFDTLRISNIGQLSIYQQAFALSNISQRYTICWQFNFANIQQANIYPPIFDKQRT